MAIKIVRMSTGEDVLADIVESLDGVKLENAVVIVPTQEGRVTFVPYSPFTEQGEEINVKMDKVVFIANANKEFEDQHKKMFGGIITPDSRIVA